MRKLTIIFLSLSNYIFAAECIIYIQNNTNSNFNFSVVRFEKKANVNEKTIPPSPKYLLHAHANLKFSLPYPCLNEQTASEQPMSKIDPHLQPNSWHFSDNIITFNNLNTCNTSRWGVKYCSVIDNNNNKLTISPDFIKSYTESMVEFVIDKIVVYRIHPV